MENNENILTRLAKIGEELDSIKPFILEYIVKIENYIAELFSQRENAINILKKNPITVASISKEIQCSRTTLYNHSQLLKRYIEQCSIDYNSKHPLMMFEVLKEENISLKEQVDKMCIRDIKYEVLKNEYATVVRKKDEEIERLRKRVEVLTNQNKDSMTSSSNPRAVTNNVTSLNSIKES